MGVGSTSTKCHVNFLLYTLILHNPCGNDQKVMFEVVIPTSSIENRGTRRFVTIFEYSNFRVIDPSIRVLEFFKDIYLYP